MHFSLQEENTTVSTYRVNARQYIMECDGTLYRYHPPPNFISNNAAIRVDSVGTSPR